MRIPSLYLYRASLALLTGGLTLLAAVHYQTRQEAARFLCEREAMRVQIQTLEQQNGALKAQVLTPRVYRSFEVHTFETAQPQRAIEMRD